MKRSYRHWSRDEAIREIRSLAERGVPLNSGYIAREHPALAYAARKYIGTWEQAILAAGLDYEQIRRKNVWNRRTVIDYIRRLHENSERLNVSYAERKYRGLVGAASTLFGSWRRAIHAAGLDYASIRLQKEWSKKEIVREIRRLRREGVNLATTIEVREKNRALHAAAVRYYGSWVDALRAARLERVLKK